MHGLTCYRQYLCSGYTMFGDNPQCTERLHNRYTAVIDAMQGFNNTFGFLVGDDIAGSPSTISLSSELLCVI